MKEINIQSYNSATNRLKVNGKWRNMWRYSCRKIFRVKLNDRFYVIKVSHINGDGAGEQNRQEYDMYKKFSAYDKRFFAKVFEYGTVEDCGGEGMYCYVIQEYIYKHRNQKMSQKRTDKIHYLSNKYGFDDVWDRTSYQHLKEYRSGVSSRKDVELYNALVDIGGNLKIIDWGVEWC